MIQRLAFGWCDAWKSGEMASDQKRPDEEPVVAIELLGIGDAPAAELGRLLAVVAAAAAVAFEAGVALIADVVDVRDCGGSS